MQAAEAPVTVGRIAGLFGVRGWVRVHSYTEPRRNVLDYAPWQLVAPDGARSERFEVREGREHGKGLVARLSGLDDPDQASGWVGAAIMVPRSRFPEPEPGSWYWADLVGLMVCNEAGEELGTVERLFETGANDVMVVNNGRRRLIPFLPGPVVRSVDAANRRIIVDWDPDF